MKKIQFASVIVAALFIISCGGLNKMAKDAQTVKYTVTPKPLELHADSVEVSITGNFPPKYFNKKVIVEVTPVLKWEGGEKAFEVKKLQGESVEDNNQVINNAEGGSYSYTAKIPYEDGMRISDLNIKIKGYVAGKESQPVDFEPYKVADGVVSTANLVKLDSKGIIGKDKFERIVPETKYAEILYTIQQSNIRGSEARNEQMKALKEYIKEVKDNERKSFKGVSISSYSSPDGDEQEINAPLADKRGKSAEKYMKKEFKKIEEAKENEAFVASQTTAEDWEGFKELVSASELADKDLILRVLSMQSDPAQREQEIKNISATYLDLAKNILPKLRRSKINVNVDLIGYSDEELKAIYAEKADSLNVEELLYTATLLEGDDAQLACYKKVSEIYAQDWRGFNNSAVIYIAKSDLDNAKTELQKAKSIDASNPIIMNNCAAVQIREGNFAKAEELLTSAGSGKEVNYNKGIVAIKKADYAGATAAFGDDCSFNAGLAKLLNGDNSGASKAIDCSDEDKASADGYYLKAVAGARSDDSDMVLNNLRAAIEKNADLKAQAKTDIEFAKYFENDTFKSIIE